MCALSGSHPDERHSKQNQAKVQNLCFQIPFLEKDDCADE